MLFTAIKWKFISFIKYLNLIVILLISSLGFAQTTTAEKPAIVAIQNRPYVLNSELSVSLGYLPLDHFNTYFSAGMAYTKYFNDYIGWEILNLQSPKNSPTGLEKYLIDNFGALPEEFDILKYYFSTNFVYTPLYMKNLFMSRSVMWGDISLVGGYGISKFQDNGNVNTLNAGAIIRFQYEKQQSFKLDIRNHFYLLGALKPNMSVSVVYSYNFQKSAEASQ